MCGSTKKKGGEEKGRAMGGGIAGTCSVFWVCGDR